jgi:hypothetical protein
MGEWSFRKSLVWLGSLSALTACGELIAGNADRYATRIFHAQLIIGSNAYRT